MEAETRKDKLAWWATGLGLIPLGIVGASFAYGVLGTLIVPVVTWLFGLSPVGGEGSLILNILGLAFLALLVVGVPYLVVGVLLLTLLRYLAGKGWDDRRLRRAAVIIGVVATAPFVVFIPAGVAYGLIVPLPHTRNRELRRIFVSTAIAVILLFLMLIPLSLLVGHRLG